MSRPEGDVTKQVGRLTGKAEYVEGSGGEPGRLVGTAKVYPEFKPFVKARKDDIGLSVRVGVEPSGKQKDGVPVVENMLYARSLDYVTAAGRGGKIEEMYESFRQEANQGGNPPHQENDVTKEELQAALQEALKPTAESINTLQATVAKQGATIDRLQEANTKIGVERSVDTTLAASGLNQRGQARVKSVVMASLPMENGAVNMTKLQEAVTAAIDEEKVYLQENGVRLPGAAVVSLFGAPKKDTATGKPTQPTEDELLAEASKSFDTSMANIMGKEIKTA